MKKILFFCLCMICLLGGASTVAAAYDMKPVAFIVLDRTGEVKDDIFKDWKQQVRQGYHVPYYYIIDSSESELLASDIIKRAGESTAQLDKHTLQQIANAAKVKVVALLVVNKMEEISLNSMGWGNPFHDNEDLTRVYAFADIYVYKLEENKMLKKVLRSVVTDDAALVTPANIVIKYELRSLVNTMENRPQL